MSNKREFRLLSLEGFSKRLKEFSGVSQISQVCLYFKSCPSLRALNLSLSLSLSHRRFPRYSNKRRDKLFFAFVFLFTTNEQLLRRERVNVTSFQLVTLISSDMTRSFILQIYIGERSELCVIAFRAEKWAIFPRHFRKYINIPMILVH